MCVCVCLNVTTSHPDGKSPTTYLSHRSDHTSETMNKTTKLTKQKLLELEGPFHDLSNLETHFSRRKTAGASRVLHPSGRAPAKISSTAGLLTALPKVSLLTAR